MSRTVRNTFPPVAASARPVSGPIPAEQPVTMKTLSSSLPTRSSFWMIWRAVGRASPGPARLEDLCASVYLFGILAVVVKWLVRFIVLIVL